MKNIVLLYCFSSLIVLLSGCAPYVPVQGQFVASEDNFEVDLPNGWRKHDQTVDQAPLSRMILEQLEERRKLEWDVLRITKDGLTLQQISIGRIPADEELPHTKKTLSREMLPQELAKIVLDNFRSNANIANFKVTENAPATVGGYQGFKLLYEYKTKQGLKVKVAYYGAMVGDWYYYLLYEAPARHYYPKDYPVFEKVKKSFRILKGNVA